MIDSRKWKSLLALADTPPDRAPWPVMREIHDTMTNKANPIKPENPLVPRLLGTYKAFMDNAFAIEAFADLKTARQALLLTMNLADRYPPDIRKYMAIGMARTALMEHVRRLTLSANAGAEAKPVAPQPAPAPVKAFKPKKNSRSLGYEMPSNLPRRPLGPKPTHKHIHFLDEPE